MLGETEESYPNLQGGRSTMKEQVGGKAAEGMGRRSLVVSEKGFF